jgi:hypothetical protein
MRDIVEREREIRERERLSFVSLRDGLGDEAPSCEVCGRSLLAGRACWRHE